jgi:hypothetical protein
MPIPNVFKSGNTATNGCIYEGQFTIGVDDSFGYGPTSATSFWNGVSPSTWSIYQNKASNGPSILTAANDSAALSILQRLGATGTTLPNALAWVTLQSPNTLAVNRDYPSIVTSGLTFQVDSGYAPSYPQQGSSWYDLTLNNNNPSSSALNSGSYSSANGGIIKLPTTTPSLSATTTNVSATTYTYGAFVYISATTRSNFGDTSTPCIIGTRQTFTTSAGPSIWISGTTASTCRLGFNNINFTGLTNYSNSWRYFVGTQDATTQRFYVNGNQVASATSVISSGSTDRMFIGGTTSTMGGPIFASIFDMTGYTFHVYNRALSASEVSQNWNALKGRVGL